MKLFHKSKTIFTNSNGVKVKHCFVNMPQSLHDGVISAATRDHRSFSSQVLHYIELGLQADNITRGE